MSHISEIDRTVQSYIDALCDLLSAQINCRVIYNLLSSQLGPSHEACQIVPYLSHSPELTTTPEITRVHQSIAARYYSQYFPHFEAVSIDAKIAASAPDCLDVAAPVNLGSPFDFANNMLILPAFGPLNHTAICIIDATSSDQSLCDLESHLLLSKIYMAVQNYHILAVSQIIAQAQDRTAKLSDREKEILTWMSRGKSNSVIGEILGISMHTVTGYVRNIYLKTQTNDRTSAAIYALSNGLLHTPGTTVSLAS